MKLLLLALIVSCSTINQESRQHHEQKHIGQHGFVQIKQKKVSHDTLIKSIDEKSALRGHKVYQRYCYQCHGVNAMGDGPNVKNLKNRPINLIEKAKLIPNFKFYIKISKWKGEMPGWKNHITEKEIEDIENYIRSLALAKN